MSRRVLAPDWKEGRRRAARDAIVDAAWEVVRREGLSGLSMRDLAAQAGITTPTVYAYFDSKNTIFDAMFARAAADFADLLTRPYRSDDPRAALTEGVQRFVEFCTADVARYQLLFQRTIPGFEPTPESFAPAVLALDATRARLARNGITDPRHVDMWTAWTTGLVDQQISNDPGGARWTRLIEDFVDMFLSYCHESGPARRPSVKRATAKGSRR